MVGASASSSISGLFSKNNQMPCTISFLQVTWQALSIFFFLHMTWVFVETYFHKDVSYLKETSVCHFWKRPESSMCHIWKRPKTSRDTGLFHISHRSLLQLTSTSLTDRALADTRRIRNLTHDRHLSNFSFYIWNRSLFTYGLGLFFNIP